MMILENGTRIRNTPAGMVATRGKRELHLLGTSVDATLRSRELLAGYTFNTLFARAHRAPGQRNVAFLKMKP